MDPPSSSLTAAGEPDARYRTLFETLIEGFCTIEMVFDAAGNPVDYRFLEVNPAFERHTGIPNAKGRLMREIAPDIESFWAETFGKVAVTGEPARFENEAKPLGRMYEVSAYRIGGPGSRNVGIVFIDITERKSIELALRAQFERMNLLHHIARAVGERQDLPSIFQVVVGTLEDEMPLDFACMCLYRRGDQRRGRRERRAAQRAARGAAGAHRARAGRHRRRLHRQGGSAGSSSTSPTR